LQLIATAGIEGISAAFRRIYITISDLLLFAIQELQSKVPVMVG